MLQLKCASGLIFIYFETLVQINLLNTVACGPSLVYMLQFLLNNFKLMAKNLQKRNKLDDSALIRTQSYTVSLKFATLNFYQMCVSDDSCLCEACMFFFAFLAICIHAITGSLQHITFSSWVYYKVNIGRIYPLELYNVHKGGLKHHQPSLFLKAIPLT